MTYPKGLSIHTIWDEIAYLLDSTKDLLSLALTCRTFKDLIIPDHIEYRHIRCSIRRQDVWKHLESRPRLTRGVRFLELLVEYSNVAPSNLLPGILESRYKGSKMNKTSDNILIVPKRSRRSEVTKENLDRFLGSLSHMTLLKGFIWVHQCIPPQGIVDISSVLTNTAHCLEGLSLIREYYDQSQYENLSIWKLSGLKKVILEYPCPASIHMILYSCPYIEDLSLSNVDSDLFQDIIQYANWNNLRRLSICETYSEEGPIFTRDYFTLITSFFDRHPNLESLEILDVGSAMPALPSSCLPKLHSICSDNKWLIPTFLSRETISRFVHLDCPIDNIDPENFPKLDKLETLSFEVPTILPKSFISFLSKAPNLKKLNVDIWNPEKFYDVVSADHASPAQRETLTSHHDRV
ncbi:hypothetical protein Clacol_007064 [Clathrus columnatus]|uniref:F-box domain-containing protein n=1 Tax=Clathrus columnatus TaxID=1419009 RepID=A0AAV5AJH1_9AGAM|nr:hypothetical protein Clacol_007064 [Clathrus columnatus]